MKNNTSSITVDDETIELAEQLSKRYNKSIPDTIKMILKKEKARKEFKITEEVKRISGILKTDLDYKTLRNMSIDENPDNTHD